MPTLAVEKFTPQENPPVQTVTQSVSKGTLAGIIANIARFGTRLVIIPIMISHLGLGGYGIWAVVMVIASYLRFGSAGIKTCFQKYVAQACASGDFRLANQLLTTGATIFFVLSAIVLIPVAIFPHFVAHLAGIPTPYISSSGAAVAVLAISYLFSNSLVAFESAVLGAHRVDLMQYVMASFMVLDALLSVAVLLFGFGIAGLALVMAISELGYATSGVLMARRIVPQISLRPRYLTTAVIPELVRFTGSYQVLNLMELFYYGVVPIVLLRELGAEAAGVYAICDRVTRFATMGFESSLSPLLSGSTAVFSAGSREQVGAFLKKVFKLTLLATVLPLAFVSAFGRSAVLAWTGQANALFGLGIILMAAVALLRSLGKMGMVMYRSSGGALMDNWAQLIRIAVLILIVAFAKMWGFYAVVGGLLVAEFAGMVFMLKALFRKVAAFGLDGVFRQITQLLPIVIVLIGVGEAMLHAPLPINLAPRSLVSVRLCIILIFTTAMLWPAFVAAGYFSLEERAQISTILLPWRRAVGRGQ